GAGDARRAGVRVPWAPAPCRRTAFVPVAHHRDLREGGAARRHHGLRRDGDRVSRCVRPPRRGGAPHGGGDGAATAEGRDMRLRWEDLVEGAGLAPITVGPISRSDIVQYQGASGDLNPIHHDEMVARAAGYPAPLGIGMLPAGIMAAWAADWLGPENA